MPDDIDQDQGIPITDNHDKARKLMKKEQDIDLELLRETCPELVKCFRYAGRAEKQLRLIRYNELSRDRLHAIARRICELARENRALKNESHPVEEFIENDLSNVEDL
jgi:hypothetical protein